MLAGTTAHDRGGDHNHHQPKGDTLIDDLYTALPAELRGNNLESHTGWPRQWTAPDPETAMRTRIALGHVITVGGIQGFTIDVTANTGGTTITLNRTLTP